MVGQKASICDWLSTLKHKYTEYLLTWKLKVYLNLTNSFTHEPFTINLKYLCRLYGLLLTTCLLLAQFNSRSYKLKTILSNNWVTHSNTAISVQRSWIVFALYIWPAVPFALYIMLNVALAYNLSAAEQVELL